jgi:hypothetical protein
MASPALSEHEIHKAVVKYLNTCGRKDILWFHPENARKCTPRQGAMRKRIGVKAGVPDFVLIVDGDPVFLELKSAKGRPSQQQRAFANRAVDSGCRYFIARSLDEAIFLLEFINAIDKRFVRKA